MHLSSDTGLATSLNTADICLVIIQPDIYNGRPARMVESKLLVDRKNCNLYVFYTYIHTYINPEQARNLFRSTFQRVSSRLLQIFARG